MSLVMEILEGLWYVTANYKGMRVNIFGFPMLWKPNRRPIDNSLLSTTSRLKKNGFIETKNGEWSLTEKGRKYFESKNKLAVKFNSPFKINAPRNLLLMFDIPETRRVERNWLRWHLVEFQYHMIQKSVWVGPSPLPKKFVEHVKNMKLDKFIKTFKLAKPYKINREDTTK